MAYKFDYENSKGKTKSYQVDEGDKFRKQTINDQTAVDIIQEITDQWGVELKSVTKEDDLSFRKVFEKDGIYYQLGDFEDNDTMEIIDSERMISKDADGAYYMPVTVANAMNTYEGSLDERVEAVIQSDFQINFDVENLFGDVDYETKLQRTIDGIESGNIDTAAADFAEALADLDMDANILSQ